MNVNHLICFHLWCFGCKIINIVHCSNSTEFEIPSHCLVSHRCSLYWFIALHLGSAPTHSLCTSFILLPWCYDDKLSQGVLCNARATRQTNNQP